MQRQRLNAERSQWVRFLKALAYSFQGLPAGVLVAGILLAFGGSAWAQDYRATLTGRITDPSGAVVPAAKVIATKVDTNSRFETVSTSEGLYTLPLLPPGQYELAVEAAGFKRYIQTGIRLGTNERVSQDVSLEVGGATESVTVSAEAPALQSVTASSGQVITTREVENLPINGRAPMQLAFLAFGVITNGNRDQNRPYENAGFSNFAMGGAPSGANEALLDGVPNTGTLGVSGRRAAFSPPVDSVSEVKVEVFNVDASYGGAGGGTVNIVTKGGTNQLHGTLSEYNQTSALAATPFFTNAAGKKKTVSRQNQWTVTAGGPVYIPRIFDGRDKVFFYFAYEGHKNSEPSPVYTTVPTEQQRNGDFSSLLALGSSYIIYDPNTAVKSGTTIVRQPFPNNVIPKERLNPVALKAVSYYGKPNFPGKADGTNNYFAPLTTGNDYHSYLARGDFNISNKNKLTINMRTSLWEQRSGDVFSNIAAGESAYRSLWGGMVDDVHTFAPTLIGNFRLGYNRYRPYYVQKSIGFNPTELGFPDYIARNANVLLFPRFAASGYQELGDGHFVDQPFDTYQALGNFTKILGNHTMKFGSEIRLLRFSNFNWSGATGYYSFDSTWVKATSSSSGQPLGGSMAAFLLGLPTSGSYTINAASTYESYYPVLYFQDDWRIRPNLTLNLGLRWEYNTPTVERWNRQTIGFNASAVNAVTEAAKANYAKSPLAQLAPEKFNPSGGLMFATADHRNAYTTPKNSFSPRVGVSWTPAALRDKTVFRAGLGIFFYNYGILQGQQQGFSSTTSYVATNDSYLTPATTLSNPFPSGITQPPGASLGVNTFLGQSITFLNPKMENLYSLRWSFDIQHQLTKDTVIQLGYIGNHSVHLMTSYNFGALPAEYLSRSLVRDDATIKALSAVVTNPFAGLLPGSTLNGSTISTSNLLRPFPSFTGVTMNNMNNGGSYFHSFAAKLQRRLSNGLMFVANYTHSRLMERASYLNSGSLELEKRVSSSDRPNTLTLTAVYDLPVGRGRKYLAGSNRLINAIIGEWAVAGAYTYANGAPLSWGNVLYYGGDLNYDARRVDKAFDTTRFETASAKQLSQNYRYFPSQFNNLRVCGTNNINLTLSKDFRINERVSLEYRAESFNLTNRAQFSGPNLTPTSTAFGVITSTTNAPRVIQMGLRLVY